VHAITFVCQNSVGGTHRSVGSLTVTASGLPGGGDGSAPIAGGIAVLLGAFVAGGTIAVSRRRVLAKR
jgi:hypothetical protein